MAKQKRTSQGAIVVSDSKQVRHGGNPDSYKTKNPTWSFRLLDQSYPKWSFSDTEPLYSKIICKLASLEGMTWAEIESASGGKKPGHGSNSHFIPISEIDSEAQKRLRDRHMDDIDELFSLRLGGTERIWGILESSTLQVLWYDRNHEIAKTSH